MRLITVLSMVRLNQERRLDTVIERKDYLTPNQAGKRMGVSGQTVRRWAAAGLIPHVRQPSGRILIHKDHAVVRPSN